MVMEAMEATLRLAGVPSDVMQPHIVLPSQHFGPPRQQAPEQRLMTAVLQEALECVEKHRCATDTHGLRLFHDAKRWFLANETDWPYSFESICGVLDLDASAVRHRLRLAPNIYPCHASLSGWAAS
jgi:hypothetical protein